LNKSTFALKVVDEVGNTSKQDTLVCFYSKMMIYMKSCDGHMYILI